LCNVLSLDDGDGLSDASVQNIRTILDLINWSGKTQRSYVLLYTIVDVI
jgi:hypothetical protein